MAAITHILSWGGGGGKGVGGGLQADPTIPCFRMTFEEFATATHLRLGLPHPLLVGTMSVCTCIDTSSATHIL